MRRRLFATLAAALLGPCLSCDRSRPSAAPSAADDYPIAVGLKWTYRGPFGATGTREMRAEREAEGRTYVEVHYDFPPARPDMVLMRRTPDGVIGRRDGVDQLILKLPMAAGDTWTIDWPTWPEVVTCAVAGTEEVEFLGARRTATRLNIRRRDRTTGRVIEDAEWYAPGYGLVGFEATKLGLRAAFALARFEKSE